VEPKLKFRAPAPAQGIQNFFPLAPEQFGPLKTKKHCIICTSGLLYQICLLNRNSNFRLRLHHSKFLGTSFRLRLHSPGWNQLLLEMNNIGFTNAIGFAWFVCFLCLLNCPFISLALKYFQIEIIFLPTLKL